MARYALGEDDVRFVLALLWTQGSLAVDPDAVEAVTGDPGDGLLLALASREAVGFLVTGDRGLLAVCSFGRAAIMTPHVFVDDLAMR